MYCFFSLFFFFNDPATTEIYTLSLHDALPISVSFLPDTAVTGGTDYDWRIGRRFSVNGYWAGSTVRGTPEAIGRLQRSSVRSEEHTSELQSQSNLVCRLLLEKKKKQKNIRYSQ